MDFSTAAEILKALASLSGMITTYLKFRSEREKLVSTDPGKEQLTTSQSEMIIAQGEEAIKYVDQKQVEYLQALPKDIGKATKHKIGKILKRYSDAIRSPISVLELDRESEIAEFEICHTLKLIKKHNGGKLPNKQMRDLWEAFNCDKADTSEHH